MPLGRPIVDDLGHSQRPSLSLVVLRFLRAKLRAHSDQRRSTISVISGSPILCHLEHFRQAKPAYLARSRIKHKQVGTLLAVLPHFKPVFIDVKAGDLR
jgi:hypothetical protein